MKPRTSERRAGEMATLTQKLVREIAPILHDHRPEVQSAVLGDLFAMWLAGHQGSDAVKFRERAIVSWLITVRAPGQMTARQKARW
jgi:hypothetical protein